MSFSIGGTEFSNSGANDIASDAILLTFDDGDTAGSVRMTIEFQTGKAGVDDNAAHINDIYLNVASGISSLNFNYVSGIDLRAWDYTSNAHSSGGSHGWDVKLDYAPPTNGTRFYVGDTSVYDITGTGLLASSFFGQFNQSGHGLFEAMAHVNAIDNGNSGHYADSENSPPPPPAAPEPHALLVWSILISTTLLRRSK